MMPISGPIKKLLWAKLLFARDCHQITMLPWSWTEEVVNSAFGHVFGGSKCVSCGDDFRPLRAQFRKRRSILLSRLNSNEGPIEPQFELYWICKSVQAAKKIINSSTNNLEIPVKLRIKTRTSYCPVFRIDTAGH